MFGTTIENAARTAVAAAENAAHTAVAAENAVCTAAVAAESAAWTAVVAAVAETNVTNVFVSAVIGKIRKQSKTFFKFLTVLLYFLFSILVK